MTCPSSHQRDIQIRIFVLQCSCTTVPAVYYSATMCDCTLVMLCCYCIMLLYDYIPVRLCYCIIVLLWFCCTTVLLYHCDSLLLPYCTTVLLYYLLCDNMKRIAPLKRCIFWKMVRRMDCAWPFKSVFFGRMGFAWRVLPKPNSAAIIHRSRQYHPGKCIKCHITKFQIPKWFL